MIRGGRLAVVGGKEYFTGCSHSMNDPEVNRTFHSRVVLDPSNRTEYIKLRPGRKGE